MVTTKAVEKKASKTKPAKATKATARAPRKAPPSDSGGVAAVDRALSILLAFRKGDQALSLAELATRTGLYKSTVLRLLVSLERAALVVRNLAGTYSLGSEVPRIHSVYVASFSHRDVVMGVLRELVQETGESAAFYVRQGDRRLCLYRVDSPHMLRDQTKEGDLLPLDRGSGGRLVLAYTGGAGPANAKIRKEQILVTTGELLPELSGITAPVFDVDGKFLGGLNLSIPTYRLNMAHAQNVRDAAVRLTRLLGGNYPAPPAS